jgi:hypothetical protein
VCACVCGCVYSLCVVFLYDQARERGLATKEAFGEEEVRSVVVTDDDSIG